MSAPVPPDRGCPNTWLLQNSVSNQDPPFVDRVVQRVSTQAGRAVDASVLVTGPADDGRDGDLVRQRLRGERLSAPMLVDLEVLSAWRRLHAAGSLDDRRVELAVADLWALRIDRAPHEPLVDRCWDLRDNLTVYDAAYVALAEVLDVILLTGDGRLARAPRIACDVEVLGSG